MAKELKDAALVVVDMLYDFIDGSLACQNANEAVAKTAEFIDMMTEGSDTDQVGIHDTFPILFVCDHHPSDHCSFTEQGGIWPPHCVQGTHGADIHEALSGHVREEFTFNKGTDKTCEQYSGFEGVNECGQSLGEVLDIMDIKNAYVCGIATEYCVLNTCKDLKKAGINVHLLSSCLGYVEKEGHDRTLEQMKAEGGYHII